MEISVLLVGFMIGLRHALEADHVAAVASIVTQKQGQSQLGVMELCGVWGTQLHCLRSALWLY